MILTKKKDFGFSIVQLVSFKFAPASFSVISLDPLDVVVDDAAGVIDRF